MVFSVNSYLPDKTHTVGRPSRPQVLLHAGDGIIQSHFSISPTPLPTFLHVSHPSLPVTDAVNAKTEILHHRYISEYFSILRSTKKIKTPRTKNSLSLSLSLNFTLLSFFLSISTHYHQIYLIFDRNMMEDDEEIQSQPSAGSGSQSPSPSPSPSPPNGRITVTVAAVPPPPPQQQNMLMLTLPPQQSTKPSGGGGREDCWSEGATGVLIDAWGERYLELSRGNLKQKHWKEVADIVSSREDYTKNPKTDIQCKNRIDTVKKKYKVEKAKTVAGGGMSKWIFFEKLDQLIGATAKIPPLNAITMSSSSKVPVGIPVGLRSTNHHHHHHNQYLNQKQQQQQQVIKHNVIKNPPKIRFKKRGHVETESEEESEPEGSPPDSADSLPPPPPPPPPPPAKRVRSRREVDTDRKWGNSVRVLTQAILRFGEAYEKAESEKLQQVVEMEKQRMKFAKELELQRMQFFMKTQVEISQLKHKRGGGSSGNHHTSNINNNNNNNDNNNSDCSN